MNPGATILSAREQFAAIPSAQGGVSANESSLVSISREAQEEMLQIKASIFRLREYVTKGSPAPADARVGMGLGFHGNGMFGFVQRVSAR